MAIFSTLFFCIFILITPVFSEGIDFLYNGFSFNSINKNLSLNGIAEIENNGILRLTNVTSRLLGHGFFPTPLQFKNATTKTPFSFSTAFAFSIVPEYPKLGGHGFAFTISPTKEFIGAQPSQYLGLMNSSDIGNSSNHIFAVEFDTVQDFAFGDIDDNHVGINLNTLVSNYSASAAYYSDDLRKIDLNLKSGKTHMAWIDYDSAKTLLNVTISPSSLKPKSPLLSVNLDLSPVLLDSMYLGFSASTGLLASSHYIFGWSFKMDGVARNLALSSLPSLPGPKSKHIALAVAVSVSAALLVMVTIAIAAYLIWKIRNADIIEPWEHDVGPHRFSYTELNTACKGFKDEFLLGSGGFGKVYRGILPGSKTQVAVKRVIHNSKQGLREFVSEIASIGRLRHRNLVQLQGWCRRRGDLLLVYEFMPNGSLDKFIFDEPKLILNWEQRLKIIKGVASGLLYLHEEWEQVVIHRDIKASNVLLDSELNGRLGDFGLARLYEHGSNPSTTRVVGTLGYLAPELARAGKVTTSSDVFSFGALLLEITCGRRPAEPKACPEEFLLVDWVWDKWREGCVFDVVDGRLQGEYDEAEVVLVLKLGLMCSNSSPTKRPSMRQVVRCLEGEVGLAEVLTAPQNYDTNEGFDDFIHSYPNSTFEKMSTYYSFGHGVGDVEIQTEASCASPVGLLSGGAQAIVK
ncbi:hypothetical protein ACHQM5_010323 [Ranunculus cassubicifolius]